MASEWIDDEASYQDALEEALEESDVGEIRYGLTLLGALALEEGGAFSGFGPGAASDAPAGAPLKARRRPALERRRRRPAPLLG